VNDANAALILSSTLMLLLLMQFHPFLVYPCAHV